MQHRISSSLTPWMSNNFHFGCIRQTGLWNTRAELHSCFFPLSCAKDLQKSELEFEDRRITSITAYWLPCLFYEAMILLLQIPSDVQTLDEMVRLVLHSAGRFAYC